MITIGYLFLSSCEAQWRGHFITFSVKFFVSSNTDVESVCLHTSSNVFFLFRFKPLWYCRMVQLEGSSTWHYCKWFLSSIILLFDWLKSTFLYLFNFMPLHLALCGSFSWIYTLLRFNTLSPFCIKFYPSTAWFLHESCLFFRECVWPIHHQ